jgi:hypothetical protein
VEVNNSLRTTKPNSNGWLTLFGSRGQVLYGWKDYQVYFHIQQMPLARSYGHFSVTGLRGIEIKTPQFLHKLNLSYVGRIMNSHPT